MPLKSKKPLKGAALDAVIEPLVAVRFVVLIVPLVRLVIEPLVAVRFVVLIVPAETEFAVMVPTAALTATAVPITAKSATNTVVFTKVDST